MPATETSPVRYRDLVSDSARWSGFELRPGDIVISTPPKSGTTWMQMLCALLVFDGPDLLAPLEQLSPWIDMLIEPVAEVHARLGAQQHRRIIKTHTPLDAVPQHPDVHYVVVGRDPRDVAVSFDHHLANLDIARLLELRATATDDDAPPAVPALAATPAGRFRQFLTDDPDGVVNLAGVLHHLGVAWARRDEPNIHLFHYADLTRDLPGELHRLARLLGFPATRDRAAQLAGEAAIERMRARASEVAPSASLGLWRDPNRFIRTGGRGEWRAWITPEDVSRYWTRVLCLASPGLAKWAHKGSTQPDGCV